MMRSKILAGALALLPAAGLLAVTQLADAHHPEIAGRAVCVVDSTAQVTLDVVSWAETNEAPRRVNRNITVTWDGKVVGSGQFTAQNNYAFTLTLTVPTDDKAHVAVATATDAFGPNGEYGFQGEFRTVNVDVPGPCPTAPTTTSTTTTTAPPPVVNVPTTTAPETQVLGETVTRPDVAVPVEVLPRFAG